ncbi:uncharacterized protein MELLADRAFT_93311 [Melampsora larici-populina 98AG31]|uniref:Uncharacterized protein n=1 Tax=Melampsora larici-populina (strain 98AG31 / pathotype 3-4-7) TaxID=747676 RepID=F4S4R1_MELLP|nr:uncharacterized protein MELLADRAFT_93311 [Melampsora larici-populina 98AG31]EGG00335.1 hypothetical protein MELLADRAFT_93311 [Melampsora larici-populina 98AG31]
MPMINPIERPRPSRFWSSLQSVHEKWTNYKTWISVACVLVIVFIYSSWLTSKYEDQTKPLRRVRIGVSHVVNTSGKPVEELPACGKTMLYTFKGLNGMGSELALWTEAAAVATWLNYTMLLDDSKWNYGKLSDYFDIPPLECRPPSNWREMPRTLFSNLGKNESDHVWATRGSLEDHPTR